MSEVKENMVQASNLYNRFPVFRAAIAVIPMVGGSLDILMSSLGQKFEERRINKFLMDFGNEISALKEEKINKDYLNSEAGYDLISKVLSVSSKTRQNEKLILYARIVKNALDVSKKFEDDEPETFLRIIEELSVKELQVAWYLYKMKKHPTEGEKGGDDAYEMAKLYPQFTTGDLISVFLRLEKTGLIKELVGSFLGYSGGVYLINPLFEKLIEFVETVE